MKWRKGDYVKIISRRFAPGKVLRCRIIEIWPGCYILKPLDRRYLSIGSFGVCNEKEMFR